MARKVKRPFTISELSRWLKTSKKMTQTFGRDPAMKKEMAVLARLVKSVEQVVVDGLITGVSHSPEKEED